MTINYKKLMVLSDLLGIENNEKALEYYFSGFDNAKFIETYNTLKTKTNVKFASKYMSLIITEIGFEVNKELCDTLLFDEELTDLVMNSQDKENNNVLIDLLIKSISTDEDEFEETSVYADEKYPLYSLDEEREVFRKYDAIRKKISDHIFDGQHEDFIGFIKSLNPQDKTEFSMLIALERLYSNTEESEVVINIKKDRAFNSLVEEAKEIRDDIALHNYRLALSIAIKFQTFGLPLDDLKQEASIGLLKGIEKYDVTKGFKFSTYATWWINQAVKRALSNDGAMRIPVYIHERKMKINKAIKDLREQDGIEEPTIEEIYKKCQTLGLDLTLANVRECIEVFIKSNPTSLNKPVGEDGDTELAEFISTEDNVTESYAEDIEGVNEKSRALDKLLDEEKTVREKKEKSIAEIAVKEIMSSLDCVKTSGSKDYLEAEFKAALKDRYFRKLVAMINMSDEELKNFIPLLSNYANEIRNLYKRDISFDYIKIITKSKGTVKILLTRDENKEKFTATTREGKIQELKNFLNQYKIDLEDVVSISREDRYVLTNTERAVIVFALRRGMHDLEEETLSRLDYKKAITLASRFLELRNYNEGLFEEDKDSDKLTLEKVGTLFGITRERIRQIESKVNKKISFKKKVRMDNQITHSQILYMDNNRENLFELLRIPISNRVNYEVVDVSGSEFITIDSDYNITPIKPGEATITIRNTKYKSTQYLRLYIYPSIRSVEREININRIKGTLGYRPITEKDNQ